MTQYNTLYKQYGRKVVNINAKLSDLQLNKLKSGKKNGIEATLNLSSNVIGNFNNKTNFPHKLLLTNS